MQLTWKQTMPAWWSFMWRAIIFGALLGALLGFFAGAYASLTGVPQKAALYGTVAGWVATIPASMLALKQTLSKHVQRLATTANAS